MKTVIISGRQIALQERSKAQLKGITIGDLLSYRFFDGSFHGVPLLFAEPKGGIAPPRSLAATASGISAKFNLPVVFLLSACPAYERQRLIDKEVFFVVSDKYRSQASLQRAQGHSDRWSTRSLIPRILWRKTAFIGYS